MNEQITSMISEELAWSARAVNASADVVPRFRVLTPEGEYYILVQMLAESKLTIGPSIQLGQEQCDPEFVRLLPDTTAAIDADTMAQLEKVFGLGGEMEAQPAH